MTSESAAERTHRSLNVFAVPQNESFPGRTHAAGSPRVETFSNAALAIVFLLGILLIPLESALPESPGAQSSKRLSAHGKHEIHESGGKKVGKDQKKHEGKHTFTYCLTTRGRIVARNKQCKFQKGETPIAIIGDAAGEGNCAFSGTSCSAIARTGVLASTFNSTAAAQVWTVSAGLPLPAAAGLSGADVVIAASSGLVSACGSADACLSSGELTESTVCAGSAASPTAPPGTICIYPLGVMNTSGLTAEAVPNTGPAFGFTVSWETVLAGPTSFYGVWVYTPAD